MTAQDLDYIDLEACAREGHDTQGASRFRVRIDDETYRLEDGKVTGRQLLALTGQRPIEERLIFLKLASGKLEEIRLDELVDLTRRGVERFMSFDSAVSFRLTIDGERIEWGAKLITGLMLKELSGVDPATYAIWQEVRGAEDVEIGDNDLVDLSEDGLERFFTVIAETTAGDGEPVLPSRDREYLEAQGLSYRLVYQNGQTGVIFSSYSLPEDQFNAAATDLLILLPSGYPDAAPDMFHCLPWVRLVNGRYPDRADYPVSFNGQNWQRWSRHNNQWRPGKDGIWTMLKRVDRALNEAA